MRYHPEGFPGMKAKVIPFKFCTTLVSPVIFNFYKRNSGISVFLNVLVSSMIDG